MTAMPCSLLFFLHSLHCVPLPRLPVLEQPLSAFCPGLSLPVSFFPVALHLLRQFCSSLSRFQVFSFLLRRLLSSFSLSFPFSRSAPTRLWYDRSYFVRVFNGRGTAALYVVLHATALPCFRYFPSFSALFNFSHLFSSFFLAPSSIFYPRPPCSCYSLTFLYFSIFTHCLFILRFLL